MVDGKLLLFPNRIVQPRKEHKKEDMRAIRILMSVMSTAIGYGKTKQEKAGIVGAEVHLDCCLRSRR